VRYRLLGSNAYTLAQPLYYCVYFGLLYLFVCFRQLVYKRNIYILFDNYLSNWLFRRRVVLEFVLLYFALLVSLCLFPTTGIHTQYLYSLRQLFVQLVVSTTSTLEICTIVLCTTICLCLFPTTGIQTKYLYSLRQLFVQLVASTTSSFWNLYYCTLHY